MPPPDDATRLRHMLDFARKAVGYIRGKNRNDLDSDELLALALVRLLEVIGEAANAVSEAFKEKHSDVPWRRITGTRNRLAHGYIDVDMDIVWTIVSKDLPPLIRQLQRVIKSEIP